MCLWECKVVATVVVVVVAVDRELWRGRISVVLLSPFSTQKRHTNASHIDEWLSQTLGRHIFRVAFVDSFVEGKGLLLFYKIKLLFVLTLNKMARYVKFKKRKSFAVNF